MFTAILLTAAAMLAQSKAEEIKLPPITKEMTKLIEQLGDDEWKVRENASAKLASLDYKALGAYYTALKSDDLEVRTRARRLLDKFYSCGNSDNKIPPIQGYHELEAWKLKSGRKFTPVAGEAGDLYKASGGAAYDDNSNDSENWITKEATMRLVKRLRNEGYTRKEVAEILDKITIEGEGTSMGTAGWRKFREMQGMPEYDGPCGLGCFPGMAGLAIRARMLRGFPPLIMPRVK